jgi:hypothetical protein
VTHRRRRPDNPDTGATTAPAFGASLLAFATLLPRRLAPPAAALGALLIALYVLRLVVLHAHNVAVVATAALTGFVLSPL